MSLLFEIANHNYLKGNDVGRKLRTKVGIHKEMGVVQN